MTDKDAKMEQETVREIERERKKRKDREKIKRVCVHCRQSHNYCTPFYLLVTTKKLVTTISHNLANFESGTFKT